MNGPSCEPNQIHHVHSCGYVFNHAAALTLPGNLEGKGPWHGVGDSAVPFDTPSSTFQKREDRGPRFVSEQDGHVIEDQRDSGLDCARFDEVAGGDFSHSVSLLPRSSGGRGRGTV